MAKIAENCARIVKVSSVKADEMVKTSIKQGKTARISYQKAMYEVNHVFLTQHFAQMHHVSKNRPN